MVEDRSYGPRMVLWILEDLSTSGIRVGVVDTRKDSAC